MIRKLRVAEVEPADVHALVEEGDEWIGLLTFIVKDGECEVTSLDSLREGQGIGSKLIDGAMDERPMLRHVASIAYTGRIASDGAAVLLDQVRNVRLIGGRIPAMAVASRHARQRSFT